MGCGSLRFLTGISAPERPCLKADPLSSRTSVLSRLTSSTLTRRTLSGGLLAEGMARMTGMAAARVGLMAGGPTSTFASLNGLPLILTGSLLPLMKVVRLITVTALRTLTFLKFWTTVRLMVMLVMFTLPGPNTPRP
jgi:hypothetical protein